MYAHHYRRVYSTSVVDLLVIIRFNFQCCIDVFSRMTTDVCTPILKSLHWLPVRYRTEYKLLLLTFKALHHLAPSYLTDLLQLYHPTRTLRSSSDSLLTARCARLRNYGDRAFCVAAPKLWNDLPLNIRECGSVYIVGQITETIFQIVIQAPTFA